MTSEQRWDRTDQTLDSIARQIRLRDEHFRKRPEQGDRNERLIGTLTERTNQAMDAVNRLASIAVSHEERIDRLEDGSH